MILLFTCDYALAEGYYGVLTLSDRDYSILRDMRARMAAYEAAVGRDTAASLVRNYFLREGSSLTLYRADKPLPRLDYLYIAHGNGDILRPTEQQLLETFGIRLSSRAKGIPVKDAQVVVYYTGDLDLHDMEIGLKEAVTTNSSIPLHHLKTLQKIESSPEEALRYLNDDDEVIRDYVENLLGKGAVTCR